MRAPPESVATSLRKSLERLRSFFGACLVSFWIWRRVARLLLKRTLTRRVAPAATLTVRGAQLDPHRTAADELVVARRDGLEQMAVPGRRAGCSGVDRAQRHKREKGR